MDKEMRIYGECYTDYLFELKNIKEEIKEKEEQLTHPIMTDLTLIPTIYRWYCDNRTQKGNKVSKQEKTMEKKIFVLIIICLYSPVSIITKKIGKGIINSLSQIFKCYKYKKI